MGEKEAQDMSARAERARTGFSFIFWTLLPILSASAVSILGIWAAADAVNAPVLRAWALAVAIALGVLLVAKAIRDYRWGQTLNEARYDAVKELRNKLGPALDLMTEMALLDPTETEARRGQLQVIATHCASALVAMTPDADTRAVVFQLDAEQDAIVPLARVGRHEVPRTFARSQPDGTEVMSYLESSNPSGQLYPDTKKKHPTDYTGDRDRYRTFIRAAIYANDIVFGVVTLDAPRKRSLSKGDVRLVEFVAAELSVAFAIAAS